MDQQLMMQIQMLSEEAQKIEEHIQVMDQQANELQEIRKSIEGIKNSSENQEILANLGKGIFIKAEVKSKELFVNIGREVVIKKIPEETIEIIDNQLVKLAGGKEELASRIQDIQKQVQQLLNKARSSEKNKECDCGEDCNCNHDCGDNCECEEKCDECSCEHKH